MTDFNLIIFDCDGTLTDSESVNNSSLLATLREEGITQYDLDYAYANWVGSTLTAIVTAIQMETGKKLPDDFIVRCMRKTAALQETALRPVPDAPELVRRAAGKYKICVASNGERANVLRSLEMTGMAPPLTRDIVFTRTEVKNPKPAPDMFLLAADTLGTEPSRCLVIEDSPTGTRGGKAAGMTVWGFTGSSHDPEKQAVTLKTAGADAVFTRLIHIAEKLGV